MAGGAQDMVRDWKVALTSRSWGSVAGEVKNGWTGRLGGVIPTSVL